MAAIQPRHVLRAVVIDGLIFGAVLYVFASQFTSFSASLKTLQSIPFGSLSLALIPVIATFVFGAAAYWCLAHSHRVKFRELLAVQTATGFANRLLPAGIGGLGLYAAYFVKRGYKVAAASGLVAANNLLGFVGSALLVLLSLVMAPLALDTVRWPQLPMWLLPAGALAALALLLWAARSRKLRRELDIGFTAMLRSLAPNRRSLGGLICNVSITLLNTLTLLILLRTLGADISLTAALLSLSVGTLLGAAVPTPGGIGGVEAGILAGLVAFGTPDDAAVAAVLLYRGLTYWLPIIPGLALLQIVRRRYLKS